MEAHRFGLLRGITAHEGGGQGGQGPDETGAVGLASAQSDGPFQELAGDAVLAAPDEPVAADDEGVGDRPSVPEALGQLQGSTGGGGGHVTMAELEHAVSLPGQEIGEDPLQLDERGLARV